MVFVKPAAHPTLTSRRRPRLTAIGVALALLAAACSGSDNSASEPGATDAADLDQTVEEGAPASGDPISIPNDGTNALEGHTPRGFAGTGTGLFAGDNLNPNFPNGDGVQIWLSFALPEGTAAPTTATLRSDVLTPTGNVFEALGDLQAAPVSYDAFGPELFDLEPIGDLVTCSRPTDSSITCDVTEAAATAIADGESFVQLRLTFEQVSDSDGEQDLATFFLTDSNTNEPGIFFLDLA